MANFHQVDKLILKTGFYNSTIKEKHILEKSGCKACISKILGFMVQGKLGIGHLKTTTTLGLFINGGRGVVTFVILCMKS